MTIRQSVHTDARGMALNVKTLSVRWADGGTDAERSRAWDTMQRTWWAFAAMAARKHGYKDVYACGRSGGWLYTDPLPDESEDGEPGAYPAAFVADIDALLKAAPGMFAGALAAEIANNTMVHNEQ